MLPGRRKGGMRAPRAHAALAFALGVAATLLCSALVQLGAPANPTGVSDHSLGGAEAAIRRPLDGAQQQKRRKVLAVVGVQTGFTTDPGNPKYNYQARRQAMRQTWFPPTQEALDRLEQQAGLVVRFVAGHSPDAAAEASLGEEERAHGGFLRLNLTEGYAGLPTKTVEFLKAVTAQFDADYIVKIDDDVYFRLDRLPHAIKQWRGIGADYVGCMKTGQIIKSPRYRWFEPQYALLGGGNYFTHAWGPVYVLSGRAAENLGAVQPGALRHFANEDVTIGSWMLALNVTHYDDRRLCETNCTASSLAVYDIPVCAGLCDAASQLPQLHASEACKLPAVSPTGGLPLRDPIFFFNARPDPAWEAEAVLRLRQRRQLIAQGVRFKEYDTAMPM